MKIRLLLPIIIIFVEMGVCQDMEINRPLKKFSFGINYSPLTIKYYQSLSEFISMQYITSGDASLKSAIGYSFSPYLTLLISFQYASDYSKINYQQETQYGSDSDVDYSGYDYLRETEVTQITGNVQYNLFNRGNHKAIPFFGVGIGKQFYNQKYEKIDTGDEDDRRTTIEDNLDNFNSKINSPVIGEIQFGVEYFINESISLKLASNYQYATSQATADYKETRYYTNDTYHKHSKMKNKLIKISNRLSYGINIYF